MRKQKIFNNEGFSLVEILLAAGLLSVISLGIVKIMDNAHKASTGVSQKIDSSLVAGEIVSLLSDEKVCTANFIGTSLAGKLVTDKEDLEDFSKGNLTKNNLYPIDSLGALDTAHPRFTEGYIFSSAKLTLQEMGLITAYMKFSAEATATEPLVHVVFYVKLKRNNNTVGAPVLLKKITLAARLDASEAIKTCSVASTSSSNIWQQVAGYEGIHYSAGAVGIGTGQPAATEGLHVKAGTGVGSIVISNPMATAVGAPSSGLYLAGDYTPTSPVTFDRNSAGVWGIESLKVADGSTMHIKDGVDQLVKIRHSSAGDIGLATVGNLYSNEVPGVGGMVVGFGERNQAVRYSAESGIDRQATYNFGWCNTSGPGNPNCPSAPAGAQQMGIWAPGGPGRLFGMYSAEDGNKVGLAASGNVYTQFSGDGSGGLVGFGEYGQMLADGAAIGGMDSTNIYAVGWCSPPTCPSNVYGILMPPGGTWSINPGAAGAGFSNLRVWGSIYSANYGGYTLGVATTETQLNQSAAEFGFAYGFFLESGDIKTNFKEPATEKFHITGGLLVDEKSEFTEDTTFKKKVIIEGELEQTGGGAFMVSGPMTVTGALTASSEITASGTIKAPLFLHSSDLTLKDEVKILTNAFEKLSKIRGVNFRWKKDKTLTVGVIAQEVQKVYPELVIKGTDGKLSVNYMGLTGVLIEAIKEQDKKIEVNSLAIKKIQEAMKNK